MQLHGRYFFLPSVIWIEQKKHTKHMNSNSKKIVICILAGNSCKMSCSVGVVTIFSAIRIYNIVGFLWNQPKMSEGPLVIKVESRNLRYSSQKHLYLFGFYPGHSTICDVTLQNLHGLWHRLCSQRTKFEDELSLKKKKGEHSPHKHLKVSQRVCPL